MKNHSPARTLGSRQLIPASLNHNTATAARRRTPFWLLLALGALAVSAPATLSASAINIDISRVNTLITITGAAALANSATSYKNNNNGDTGTGDPVDAAGNSKIEPGAGVGLNDKFDITVGGETWSGLMVGANAGAISDKEKQAANGVNFGPLDFSPSYASYLEQNGLFYETFTLIDTGTSSYTFTQLSLLTGLNLADLTPAAFDSPGAIATGTLYDDVSGRLGLFTITPGQQIEFSVGSVDPSTYSLLTATVEQMLPGGGVGPAQTLALAAAPAPEPASLGLILIGLSAVGGARWRRKSRQSKR